MTKKASNIRLFTKKGLLNALPLMARATNKSEEQVIEDLVMSTEPYYLAAVANSIKNIDTKIAGLYAESDVPVSQKVHDHLKFYCEKWRSRLDELLVVCLYYSRKSPLYMTAVKASMPA